MFIVEVFDEYLKAWAEDSRHVYWAEAEEAKQQLQDRLLNVVQITEREPHAEGDRNA